jgi:hypothetical protein
MQINIQDLDFTTLNEFLENWLPGLVVQDPNNETRVLHGYGVKGMSFGIFSEPIPELDTEPTDCPNCSAVNHLYKSLAAKQDDKYKDLGLDI